MQWVSWYCARAAAAGASQLTVCMLARQPLLAASDATLIQHCGRWLHQSLRSALDQHCADLPAWLPLWTNSTLIKAALAAGCPDQWGERAPSAAYVNATLCCSGAASPALASALASGCLECGQEHSCVYNPGSPELVPSSVADELPPGSDVLAWFWDPDEGCWHEDVGEVCNATAKGAAITAEVAEAYAYQAIMLDFALKAALNNDTKTRLAVTREVSGKWGALWRAWHITCC